MITKETAIEYMTSRIEWLQYNRHRAGVDKEELSMLNEIYSMDRLDAMTFGIDVSMFPRKLKMYTRLPK